MRRWTVVTAALGGLVLLALLTLGTEVGFAAWPADGLPICQANGTQDSPKMIPDGSGGAYVVWLDQRVGSTAQIYMQRVTSAGSIFPGWPMDGLYVSYGVRVEMIGDGAGGALVATQTFDENSNDYDIFLHHVLPTAMLDPLWPAGGAQVCFWVEDQQYPTLVPDGAGGAIVAWQDERIGGGDAEIFADRINALGISQWLVGGKPIAPDSTGREPIAMADGAGGVFISAIRFLPPIGYDIFLQRVTAAGATAPGWPTAGVAVSDTAGHQYFPQLAPDGSGGVFVSWQDYRKGAESGIYALRFAASGDIAPGWTANGIPICDLVGSNQEKPKMIAGQGGTAIILWEDTRNDTADVYAQHVTESGQLLWETNGKVIAVAGDYQENSTLVSDGEGGAIVVWADYRIRPGNVRAQHIVSDGRFALPDSGLTVCTEPSYRFLPAVVTTASQDAIVAFADHRNQSTTGRDIYAQYLIGLSNLDATEGDANWTDVIVPRNVGDAVVGNPVILSPILDGNTANTYMNWLLEIEGPNAVPAWDYQLLIDVDDGGWSLAMIDSSPVGLYVFTNIGPYMIRGGRHSLTNVVDSENAIPESNETDNVWSGQWVWSPLVLIENSPVLRDPPPNRGLFTYPNTDGMMFDRHPAFAWVVAMAPLHPDDDFDLIVYDDYTGSTAGFSNSLAGSGFVGNQTDFVVGVYDGTPLNLYPAVQRFEMNAGEPFLVDQTDAAGRNGGEDASFLNQNLPPARLANVYEANLKAGTTYYFSLYRVSGLSDLDFEIFPPDSGVVLPRGVSLGGGSMEFNADLDTLALTPVTDGWHPIVVYRSTGTEAPGSDMTYNLTWSRSVLVDVPGDTPPSYTLAFHGPLPNPMTKKTRLHFTLANEGRAQLSIYDVRGRQVVSLLDETLGPGPHYSEWDGRAESGARVGAGIYWARLHAGGTSFVKRIVILR